MNHAHYDLAIGPAKSPREGKAGRVDKDVVVIGSGAAGLTAAVVAAASGLEVMLLEKTPVLGGTTAFSGGGCWVPENHLMAAAGLVDTKAAAVRYVEQVVGNHLRRDLLDAYLAAAPRMLAFMLANTAVDFIVQPGTPDYQPELEGSNLEGRLLCPAVFDGRGLGEYFDRIRPPLAEFNAPGGMMISLLDAPHVLNAGRSWKSFVHTAGLVGRYAYDRLGHARGTRLTMGNALVAMLVRSALDANVTLWREAPATGLVIEDGRVTGVEVKREGRRSVVKARKGVVLASGGFSANPEMRARFIPFAEQHQSIVPEGNTGDGLRFAVGLGGVMERKNASNSIGTPISILRNPDGSLTRFPHLYLDRPRPGCIAVNASGRRFANEAALDFVDHMQASGSLPAHLVCDRRFIRKNGLGLVYPGGFGLGRLVKAGYIVEAPDLRALSARIGVDADGLLDTVTRNNRYAVRGHDPEFGKGSNAFDRSMGDPGHRPNPCLGPIEKAPFYAVKIYPGDATTTLGLRVNTQGQVLDAANAPIEGLYACGMDMNSLWSGRPPANGCNIGLGMTFAYIIGRTLAGLSP